jgi:acetyltransferase-like isoleucine patch superfamily enzyme
MIKKTLLFLIKRYNLHRDILSLQKSDSIGRCNDQVINSGSFFYPEASVENHKGIPAKIRIGKDTHIRGQLLVFKYGGEIEIGNNSYIGEGTRVWSGEKIVIGNNVLISHNVNIVDTNSHELDSTERAVRYKKLIEAGPWENKGSILTSPIVIQDDCWISFGAIILKGITIGKGAVVAAGSVVTKDVPDYAVVAGNPARIVKYTT